ncbi:MAG: CotH kinase family protein [Ruminococcus sp.]|nr:CotH kinase family protein [Ruminococcus sp.]
MDHIKKMFGFATAVLMVSAMPCNVPFATAEQSPDGLCINEVCTQNKNCYTDSLGGASDWIELFNGSDGDIDLAGYGVSDSEELPPKFVFPSGTVIGKGEYMLITADKNGEGMTELNTGFGLSKSGETLVLSSPDGETVQKLEIPALAEDAVYGRSSDGSYSIMLPTPGEENMSSPAEPVFSLESGFYSENDVKELTIASSDTVYYTLDGTDPITSDTAQIYTEAVPLYDRSIEENVYSKYQHEDMGPYSITLSRSYEANPEKFDKATVVRAVSMSEDGTFSKVAAKTYFVMDDEKLRYYSDIPVVSLVTDPDNLFSADKGIYVTGQGYETDHMANFNMTGKDWEREADIEYFRDGELGFTQKMGMRIRGAGSRSSPAKSFNMFARSEYGDSKLDHKIIDNNLSAIDGKKIKRYDSFGLRAVEGIERLREYPVDFALKDHPDLATYSGERCMLFIDGELWGMYELTEKASDYYIQSHYGVPSENVTIIKNGEREEGPSDEPLNLQKLGEFCSVNDLSVPENYEYVASKVDIDSLIDCYCTGLYIGTWDWPNYNYFMWRNNGEVIEGNPYSDGKWRFGAFDFDYSVGLTYDDFGDLEGYQYNSFMKMDGVKESIPTVIFAKLLDNPEFRKEFIHRFYWFANDVFEPEKMVKELDAEEDAYMDYMTMTAWRWYDGDAGMDIDSFMAQQKQYLHDEMEYMRTFFRERPEYIIGHMQNYFGITDEAADITVTVNGGGSFTVDTTDAAITENVWTGLFDTGEKVTLTAHPDEGYKFAGWSGDIESDSETITVTADMAVKLECNFRMAEYELGDVDMDGNTNVADLVVLSRYLSGKDSFTRMQFILADLNEDGAADLFDLIRLRKVIIDQLLR